MTWDLWVDYLRTDGDGLTHTSTRNASPGVVLRVGEQIIVGNEDADPAVARVESIDDDGVVLVAVLAGPVEAHRADRDPFAFVASGSNSEVRARDAGGLFGDEFGR